MLKLNHMEKSHVPVWKTHIDEAEVARIRDAIAHGCLSQGAVTEQFEKELAKLLGVPYVVVTTSGTAALYLAIAAAGIGPGDEVIIPNRTFIATAHAVQLAGGVVKLVDVRKERDVIDESLVEKAITTRTKAIIPVHLNGSSANMKRLKDLAKKKNLIVIEDAAQAFMSRNDEGFLGTLGDMGCFSLGVTKFITTGQGGFVATRDLKLYDHLLRLRNHGVYNTFHTLFDRFGFNFKFTDIQAAIGLAQVKKIDDKLKAHLNLYHFYERGLKGLDYLQFIPIQSSTHQPLWGQVICSDRDQVVQWLLDENIQARPFWYNLNRSAHLKDADSKFPNSQRFERFGMGLPSGPDLPMEAAERTVEALRAFAAKVKSKVPA